MTQILKFTKARIKLKTTQYITQNVGTESVNLKTKTGKAAKHDKIYQNHNHKNQQQQLKR